MVTLRLTNHNTNTMFTLKTDSTEYAFSNAKRDHSGTITCSVTIESTGEVIPFTASPNDTESYGRSLYEQLNTTDLASVAAYTDEMRNIQDAEDARDTRDILLQDSDWTQTPDIPEATKTAWTAYRQALRDLPTTSGFPNNIDWPDQPT